MNTSSRAFTLVEILAALGIVAVLAALLIPAIQRTRAKADDATCMNNLRQIGSAILAYAADHNGKLPYIGSARMLTESRVNNGEAATVLAPYLNEPEPTIKTHYIPAMFCPAWERKFPKIKEGPCYVNSALLKRLSNKQNFYPYLSPFGKDNASNEKNPLSLAQISSMEDFAARAQWIVQDCDALNYTAASLPGLSPTPVHKTHRNVLFLDFHVEQVPAATILQ